MGCGCGGKGIKRGQSVRLGTPRRDNSRAQLNTNVTRKSALDLRRQAVQKSVEQQLQSREKTHGGMDKSRREIERKRRLTILNKLGRL